MSNSAVTKSSVANAKMDPNIKARTSFGTELGGWLPPVGRMLARRRNQIRRKREGTNELSPDAWGTVVSKAYA